MKIKLPIIIALCCVFQVMLQAQDKKPLSPTETVSGKVGKASLEIVYSRPSSRGRKMLGGNNPYGQVWRTGANAATTFTVDKEISVEGKKLAAGKYELFTIPGEKEWVIIFQEFSNQWGTFNYKEEKDVLRVTVKGRESKEFVETFTISIQNSEVILEWENTRVVFSIRG
jgi:hypothetical protein